VLCSESCALDLIDADYVCEVEPGEMVVIDENGLRSMRPFADAAPAQCIFEHVYFARPDSRVFGRDVHQTRLALGRQLAREAPADADVVVPVPDSGTVAAVGYSQESGLPIEFGLIRNHYVGRTFIEPRQSIRHFGVKVKLNPVRSVIEGRRIVLIDDSIVRGTTSRKIVGMVRHAGAKEIHLRISSPPTTGPCHYGIDTPKREELIAACRLRVVLDDGFRLRPSWALLRRPQGQSPVLRSTDGETPSEPPFISCSNNTSTIMSTLTRSDISPRRVRCAPWFALP
jgi:amidophosphoribosyltransferase